MVRRRGGREGDGRERGMVGTGDGREKIGRAHV